MAQRLVRTSALNHSAYNCVPNIVWRKRIKLVIDACVEFPKDLSRSPVQTHADMVESVLILPAEVSSHVLELHEERLQASAAIKALELENMVIGLGAR